MRALSLTEKTAGCIRSDHPQTGPRRLVAVGGTDAAFGRADLLLTLAQFAVLVDQPVIRENQVRAIADEQVLVHG